MAVNLITIIKCAHSISGFLSSSVTIRYYTGTHINSDRCINNSLILSITLIG